MNECEGDRGGKDAKDEGKYKVMFWLRTDILRVYATPLI